MIATAEGAGFLKRQNIGWLFDYAEQLDRARCVRTDIAEFVRGEVATKFARMNSPSRFGNRARDLFGLTAPRLHHPERDPFGRPRTDSGHLSKLRDQIPQRGRILCLSHASCLRLPHRHFGEIQRERLETTEIQLQWRVFFLVRPARLLKFGIRFGPSFLAIKHDAVPKTIAPRQLFRFRFGCGPERFVNFVTLPRIHAAKKINWPGDNVSAGQFKRSRPNQNPRTIKTVRYTETPRQFDRLAARDQSRSLAILQRRHNHRSGADTETHIELTFAVYSTRLTRSSAHVQRYAHCFVAVVRVRFRKTKERDHSLGIGSLNVRAR